MIFLSPIPVMMWQFFLHIPMVWAMRNFHKLAWDAFLAGTAVADQDFMEQVRTFSKTLFQET